tara:strand:+ start:929 stop:1327 length:399 start_codon:yes stop_codon:yes gene_type:complete
MKISKSELHDIILEEVISVLSEKCWDGYKQVGMKNKGGKEVPNCVPLEEEELEEDLKKWFRQNKGTGWVDCNTCRKDKKTGRKKCSPCGRKKRVGGKRKRYPACRPTPAACGKRGNWGKKSKAQKKRKRKKG